MNTRTMWGAAVVAFIALAIGACGDDQGGMGSPDAAAVSDAAPVCTPAFTLYFNRVGGTYTPGPNDARINTSKLINSQKVAASHNPASGDWDLTMECLRTIWAPFAVTVTDQDPGNAPHMEIVVTSTSPTSFGFPAGIYSASPFTCEVFENGVGFVFAGSIGAQAEIDICNAAAYAGAKMFGLDNVLGCPEVNTWEQCPNQPREFVDEIRVCGEDTARPCSCTRGAGHSSGGQNSVTALRAIAGCP